MCLIVSGQISYLLSSLCLLCILVFYLLPPWNLLEYIFVKLHFPAPDLNNIYVKPESQFISAPYPFALLFSVMFCVRHKSRAILLINLRFYHVCIKKKKMWVVLAKSKTDVHIFSIKTYLNLQLFKWHICLFFISFVSLLIIIDKL